MKQTKHWLLTVVLLLCSAAQMSGEIILTQADGLLNERIDHNDATTQYHYKSPVLTLGEATNTFVFTMLDGYSETLEWASPYDHRGFPFMCIAEFTLYDGEGNKIALDASNFSTNAQEPTEGNIAYICDGKQYTFFHSTWSGAASANHYIAITLPEDIELKDFQFEYYTRKAEFHQLHGIPAKLSISSNVAEGECGENLFWKLKVNGELSISGNGEMYNYMQEGKPIPWAMNCSEIKHITISDGVTDICEYAFSYCENLSSVELPNNLTSIRHGAFNGCASLSSITIPASVSHIGGGVFGKCTNLTNLAVAEGNPYYYSTNNCDAIIETATNTLLRGTHTTVIPNNIQNIGDEAFSGCYKLTSITLPASVENIGLSAFQNCTNLTSVSLPIGLTVIKSYTFFGCTSLSTIDLPETLQSIESYSFYDCTSLASINMPESLLSIGNSAFNRCRRLKTLNIPESVWYIGGDAFAQTAWYEKQSQGMIYLNKVLYCYKGTSVVRSLRVNDGTIGIAGYAFMGQTNVREVKLPESLEYIGNAAFYGCTSLYKIILPKNVVSIEQQAFEDCRGLKSITCYAEFPPSVNAFSAFENVSTQIPVYVPESSVSLYREHELWGRFTNIQAITEETGVENIRFVGNDAQADAVYDVNGRRIDNTQNLKKGIYIHNGRKVFVK